MSTLQRKIQEHSRSSSRARSAGNSRQSSRSSSRMGSRMHSDDEDDYTSNSFLSIDADALSQSLDGLLLDGDDDDESKGKDRFTESMEMLDTHERKTSLEAREKALLTILSVLTSKYRPEKITDYAVGQFTKAFKSARSDLERMLSLQAICVAAATDVEVAAEYVDQILPRLMESITDEGETKISANVRANYAYGYALLQFFFLFGSGAYGAQDLVQNLIEAADGFSTSASSNKGADESSVASCCILGAGLIASTMPTINPTVDDTIPFLIDLLDNPSTDVKLAAGKVIAMYYQLYDYENEEAETEAEAEFDTIPFVDQEEVLYKLRMLVSESSKKMGKRDKKEQKSVFRDVIKTITAYSSVESRDALTSEDINITHIKLARSKAISIDSWNKLILVQMYKWLYGAGVHTQLVANPFIKETVDAAGLIANDGEFGGGSGNFDDVDQDEGKSVRRAREKIPRQVNIKQQRKEKFQRQIEDTQL